MDTLDTLQRPLASDQSSYSLRHREGHSPLRIGELVILRLARVEQRGDARPLQRLGRYGLAELLCDYSSLMASSSDYWTESRRIFATLVRLLGDFDFAEAALHDAFRAAREQ